MWSNVESVSSIDESIVGVFCTNGLLRITSEQTIITTPKISGILQSNRLVISIDSILILYEDEKRYDESSFLNVLHPIEAIAVSASGNIIVCGLSNGSVTGLHITGVALFSFPVEASDRRADGPSFAGICDEGNGRFLLLTTSGSVYRVAVDEAEIATKVAALDPEATTLDGCGQFERLLGKKFDDRIVCCMTIRQHCMGVQSSFPLVVAANRDTVFFYREEKVERVLLKPEYSGVKKMFALMNCIFALTNSGQLFEICPLTKLISELPCTFRIDDLVTLEVTADVVEMLILTKADAGGKKLMKIVNFPTMEVKQEMEMSEHTWLMQQPKNSANIYYIAGQTHKEPVVQELELKILSETDPSLRLVKLIKIGRLEEAEVFAKQFDLDVQLVHKARAKLLLDELSSACNEENVFGKLMQVLEDVNDAEYLTSIRDANIGDRSMKKRFLQFLLSKVSSAGTGEMDSVIDINERLLRLETLHLIDPFEIDQDWQQFVYHENLPQLCTELFAKDMDAACLIWSRHFACILPQLDDAKVAALLRAIPKETSPLHVIQWLLHFVGPVLHHLPQLLQLLVQFIVARTKSFQKLPGWPMIGLTFMEDAIKIVQEVQFPLIDLRLQFESNMAELQRMLSALRDLVTLKQQFNLLASLDCYMQEDMELTAFRLLQITPLPLLNRIVTEFLYKFFVGQEQKLFQQIQRYIQFLVTNQYNSFWDQRCITLVELLYDEQQQLETVLTILQAAPVPWPPTVASLLKYANRDHPIAQQILLEQNAQTMKCLKIKYGWSLKAPDNERLLVQRVLKLRQPEMLADIRAIVKTTPMIAFAVDLNVIAKLAEYGEIIAAAEYLDGLDKDRKANCCRGSISMMIRMLDGARISGEIAMAYLEALQMLKHRAEPEQQKSIQQIVNIVQLRTEFGLSVTCRSFDDATDRPALLLDGIRFILSKIRSNREQFLDLLLGATRRLSSLLRYSLLDALHEVMLLLNNVHVSCLLAAQLPEMANLRQAGSFSSIHRIVSLLLAQQMQLLRKGNNGSTRWVEDPLTFPICRELLYQSAAECPTQTDIRLELLRWIQIGVRYYPFGVGCESHQRTIVPEGVFNDMYDQLYAGDDSGAKLATNAATNGNSQHSAKRDSFSAFDVVHDHFDQVKVPQNSLMQEQETIVKCVGLAMQMLLCRVKSGDRAPSFALLLQRMGPLDDATISTEFQTTLDHLIRAKQYPPVLNIVQLLMSYQASIGLLIPASYAENVYRKSIKYMLSQKEPNYSSALMTLFTCEKRKECLEYLKTSLTNESQRVSLHTLLEFYYFTIGQEESSVQERTQRLRYTLFHELCRLDPALKMKKSFIFNSQAELMRELNHKVVGVELLRKMSDAFSWDYQQMLVSQIVSFLRQQELTFAVRTNEFGQEEVVVQDTSEVMLAQLAPLLAEVENAVLLSTKLTNYMEHANGYFYEQFFTIFDILERFGEVTEEIAMWRRILRYMQEHLTGHRRHRPGQLELDAWMRLHPDGDVLPEIAKFRYPFTLIIRQPLKAVLREDITVENYCKLLSLVLLKAPMEGLNPNEMNDYFCRSAVVNSINEYKIQHKEKGQQSEWHRQTKNRAFLQSILRIVDCVKDLSSKLQILYYITCNALDGDDQVNAAYKCYRFARAHEQELLAIAEAKEKVEKIYRKYPVLRTQQLLQQNGVTDDKLYQLVKNPQELIKALYSESCFQKVKVNELTSVIGELHQLDVEAIQMTLLQKWLSMFGGTDLHEGFNGMLLEETLYDDHNVSGGSQEDDTSVHEWMARAYYILSSWERSKSIEFLVAQLNTIAESAAGSSDISKQLQIYHCFSKLVDGTSSSYQQFFTQNRYIALKCVHLLKTLGMHNFTVAKFEKADKMDLLKTLWQSHATNPKGLEVLSLICTGYNIYAPQVWNGILKQMARLGQVAHLRALIDVVSARRQLYGLEGYRMAWEILIKEPFRSANREHSLTEDAMLARSLVMVQKCPISFRLNLLEVADVCVNVNRVNMAAVLVGFATGAQKEALKKLIANNAVPNLMDQIRELEEFGLVTTVTKYVCGELNLNVVPPPVKRWR